ncbi:hypothetical protein C8R44DRAFT_889289 [Mycena epipterygia]|nr:hypothetical protein C8R44DRAFT_889289 [Mycena epipterygia]
MGEDERPTSPVSTDPGVYDRYPAAKGTISRLTYLYDSVPHLQTLLPSDYNHDTGYLPNHLPASERLKIAFPDRLEEERPSTFYYSSSGERMERPLSERTSWRSGGSFDIPPEDLHQDSPEIPKKKVTISQTQEERKGIPLREDWEHDGEDELEYDSPSTAQHWGLHSGPHALLSAMTPFKEDDKVFPRRSAGDYSRGTGVPGPGLPDPLHGIASAAPYGIQNDSISQGFQQQKEVRDSPWITLPSATPLKPPRVPPPAELKDSDEDPPLRKADGPPLDDHLRSAL